MFYSTGDAYTFDMCYYILLTHLLTYTAPSRTARLQYGQQTDTQTKADPDLRGGAGLPSTEGLPPNRSYFISR